MTKRQQKANFSLEEDESLIDYVRENEALYDFCNKRYADNVYKNTLWNTIGEKLQQDGQHCKHRWEAIRGQYRKVMKSKKTTTGQSADMRAKWKYEDQLEFLKPHMKDKQRLISIGNETDGAVEDDEDESLSHNTDMSNPDTLDMSEVSTVDIPEAMPRKRKPINKNANKQNSINQTASGTVMKYLLENERKKSDERNELDHFFDSIKASVQKFSPADIHLAKARIFMIVSDIEGKYIGQQLPPHMPTHSTSHSNMQPNIQSQIISQFQQFQYQLPLSSTQSYVSASATPMRSGPPCVSVAQSSPASSYYETFSPTDNID